MSDDEEPAMWLQAAVVAALGFELVGFVLAGVFIGTWIDGRFDSSPVGLLSSVALAMLGAGWHIRRVTRQYLSDDEAQ